MADWIWNHRTVCYIYTKVLSRGLFPLHCLNFVSVAGIVDGAVAAAAVFWGSIIKFYCCHILCRHGKVTAINAFYAFSSLRIHDFNVFTTLIHVGKRGRTTAWLQRSLFIFFVEREYLGTYVYAYSRDVMRSPKIPGVICSV